jgi:hypothetical protein
LGKVSGGQLVVSCGGYGDIKEDAGKIKAAKAGVRAVFGLKPVVLFFLLKHGFKIICRVEPGKFRRRPGG